MCSQGCSQSQTPKMLEWKLELAGVRDGDEGMDAQRGWVNCIDSHS